MADVPFLTVDRNDADVALPTAKLIDETLREVIGLAVASPAANTLGDRLKTIAASLVTLVGGSDGVEGFLDGVEGALGISNAALGAPADAAYTTGNGSIVAILKAMLASLNNTTDSAAIKLATLTDAETLALFRRIGTRAYGATTSIITAGAGATTGTQMTLPAGEVLFEAHAAPLFYKIGGSGAVSAGLTDSKHLAPGEKFHEQIATGQYVSIIRDGSTDARLLITPVA
jgi:hypothetical protein